MIFNFNGTCETCRPYIKNSLRLSWRNWAIEIRFWKIQILLVVGESCSAYTDMHNLGMKYQKLARDVEEFDADQIRRNAG